MAPRFALSRSALLSLVLVLTSSAVAVSAASLPASAIPSMVEESPVSVDERSALAAAEQEGVRVEVASARTEFSQTFATPHGTLVVEEHLRPQWVRTTDGTWVDVDPSLQRAADGSWSPVAATAEMGFSGGGAGPLASIEAGGSSMALRWPSALPEPVVDGNVARYPNVAPFVDLQVVADVDGFTHLVVLRSPKALDTLGEIELVTELSGVSLRVVASGAVEAVDEAGTVMFAGPSPMMWDSRDAAGEPAGADEDGAAAASVVEPGMAPVDVDVSPGKLTLTPDAGMLSDPDTVYPVIVDPTWIKVTGKRNHWSLLRKSFPSSAFYDPPVGSTSSSDGTRGIVRAGFVVEDRTYTDRSVFNMSTSAVRNRRVNKATFSLTQAWSYYNCASTTKPVTQLRTVGSFGSSTTWNSQPSWGSVLATSNKIRKYGYSCGPQRVEYNVTGTVRSAASSGKSSINLGLRAASETTGNWTRFKNDAKLSIEYNTAPNAASSLKVQGKPCGTGSARPFVTVNRPTFSGRASDPDSGQQSMSTRFYWWRSSSSRNSTDFVTGTSANPGTANSASVPSSKALLDRQVYKYQARTSDGIDVTWSRVCEFQAWLTVPNRPAGVASSAYPEYDPDDPGPGLGGVGVGGQFTIQPPASGVADVVGYAYTLDSGVSAGQAPTVAKRADGTGLVTVMPRRDGVNVLRVWSKDKAGLFSSVVEYRFQVRAGDGPAAAWVFDNSAARGEDDTGHGNGLAFTGDAAPVTGRAGVGQAITLDGSGDYAATAGPVQRPHPDTGGPVTVRTDATFTVAAWVRLTAPGGSTPQTLVTADGSRVYSFTLSYSGTLNRWRFTMAESNVDDAAVQKVFSDATVVANRWTHLAGTYDAATGRMRLYVNGVLQAESATLSAGFHASGQVAVGRRLWNGGLGGYLTGQVDDVRIYPYLVPAAELQAAVRPLPPTISFPDGPAAEVGGTLRVRFDAGGDTNVTSFRYSVGSDALDQTANLGTAGGTATVTIPVSTAGELPIFAAAVDRVGHLSESVTALATVLGTAEVSGVVFDGQTFEPVAGARVAIDELGLQVTSGADGSFRFAGFQPGTYTLAAEVGGGCGLASASEVDISGPTVIDLYLIPARDRFGYQCTEAPATPFVPIAGTTVPLTGDDVVSQVSLPFPVPFYGEPRTTAWVDTNGVVAFENPGASYPGAPGGGVIPEPTLPNALVAVFWADLVVDAGASVLTATAGVAPARSFTIEWRNVHLKGDTSARLTFQVTLSENGDIAVHYTGLDSDPERGAAAVLGIESPGGQEGVMYVNRQPVLATDLQVTFTYPEEPNPIITATLSGTVVDAASGLPAAGVPVRLEPAEVTVTTTASGGFSFPDLESGSYLVEARAGANCGKAGQQSVQLDTSTNVQVNLQPAADEYGYTCTAGPRGFVPTSTVLELSGDDLNQQVALPFGFDLYGETYTQAWVNTNGILVFAPETYSWHRSVEIPSVHLSPSPAIYALWSDWIVDEATSSVRTATVGAAPNRQFVIEWRNIVHVDDPNARVSMQVVLHETSNQIAVAWDEIDPTNPLEQGLDGVVGIENAEGTIGLPYQAFDQAIASGQGVLFTPGDPGLHQLTGTVTCEANPVAGAEVRVADQSATTNAQGGFSFTGVPPGPQGLVASASGGQCAGAVSMPVTANRGEPTEVEVPLTPLAQAEGYTVTHTATTMLPADTVVGLPGDGPHDDEYVPVTPPFPVKLYGQTYSSAWVDTNGYLTFADPGDSFAIPVTLPAQDPWAPRPAVFPFWNDWMADEQASIRTGVSGTAPNRRWVVEWRDVYPYPDNRWQRVSFQVVFEETTGRITFTYRDIDPSFVERGGAGLAGLQNPGGAQAVEFSHLAPVLSSDRGLIFTPIP